MMISKEDTAENMKTHPAPSVMSTRSSRHVFFSNTNTCLEDSSFHMPCKVMLLFFNP